MCCLGISIFGAFYMAPGSMLRFIFSIHAIVVVVVAEKSANEMMSNSFDFIMATTSKLSFRARNLDATKSMPVYCADELPDLAECTPINRAVAQMPTGMEKDEENV
ncbi:unnamed protein product, partial [Onchocerca ochengi]